ncbi:bacterial Ig-like domain-containing protein [Xylocopilactobacillus apicola]|uniref:Uncharacterized protein n=1 Tax=Xylocopilactobacillus apicola TaxID=2932184 RepID=A0AAU9DZH8_9LACO|nr:bacterial Ig-like domain-containing protein [Xylocopilactobacillus apicola]BDR59703.1 hypothetical protein XA3_21440 [Xylocopilactobacillus apicola]
MNSIRKKGRARKLWLMAGILLGLGVSATSVNAEPKESVPVLPSNNQGFTQPRLQSLNDPINDQDSINYYLEVAPKDIWRYFNIYDFGKQNSARWEDNGDLTLTPETTSDKDNKNLTGTANLGFSLLANSTFEIYGEVNLGSKSAGANGGEGLGFVFYSEYDPHNNYPGDNWPAGNNFYPGNGDYPDYNKSNRAPEGSYPANLFPNGYHPYDLSDGINGKQPGVNYKPNPKQPYDPVDPNDPSNPSNPSYPGIPGYPGTSPVYPGYEYASFDPGYSDTPGYTVDPNYQWWINSSSSNLPKGSYKTGYQPIGASGPGLGITGISSDGYSSQEFFGFKLDTRYSEAGTYERQGTPSYPEMKLNYDADPAKYNTLDGNQAFGAFIHSKSGYRTSTLHTVSSRYTNSDSAKISEPEGNNFQPIRIRYELGRLTVEYYRYTNAEHTNCQLVYTWSEDFRDHYEDQNNYFFLRYPFLRFAITGATSEASNAQQFRFKGMRYEVSPSVTARYVDEKENELYRNDVTRSFGKGNYVELYRTDSITSYIEGWKNEKGSGRYYLSKVTSDDSNCPVIFGERSNPDKIIGNGKNQTVTYRFKQNKSDIITKNISIEQGGSWEPGDSFDKGFDYDGSNLSLSRISQTNNVNVNKPGIYEVTYEYTPFRPTPENGFDTPNLNNGLNHNLIQNQQIGTFSSTRGPHALPKVSATATVKVSGPVQLNYVDQDGNDIEDPYLTGIPDEMKKGAHKGLIDERFTLNAPSITGYEFVQAEKKGDASHTKLPSNDLVFDYTVQEINLVYKSIWNIKFVNDDDNGTQLNDPITMDGAKNGETVELSKASDVVDKIEGYGEYYFAGADSDNGATLTFANDQKDKITSNGKPQMITYHFKKNQAEIKTWSDLMFNFGEWWEPRLSFKKGIDYDGTEFDYQDRKIKTFLNGSEIINGLVVTIDCTAFFYYTPKRPIPGTNDFKELPEVISQYANIRVRHVSQSITLHYVDQDNAEIDNDYLTGIGPDMSKGAHNGWYDSSFMLNPAKMLTKDDNVGYKLIAVKRGDKELKESDYKLTYGDYPQDITLVYQSVWNINFVNDDDNGTQLNDPITMDGAKNGETVELSKAVDIVAKIEKQGKCYLTGAKSDNGTPVRFFSGQKDKITLDGKPHTITYHFKNNQAKLTGKNISIAVGDSWKPEDSFDKGIDYDGTEFNFNERNVTYTGNVDPSKAGSYEVTYKYTPKRPVPTTSDVPQMPVDLPEVTVMVTVTVHAKKAITLHYVDQDGKDIDSSYLTGVPEAMKNGDHFGAYGSTFTINAPEKLGDSYKFVQAEKTGDARHAPLTNNTLTFGDDAQEINLVYQNVLKIQFINDDDGNPLHDALSLDGAKNGEIVSIADAKQIIDGIEENGKYLVKADSDSQTPVVFETNGNSTIKSNGKPQTITYHFKNNQASLKAKDLALSEGASWSPAASFDKGLDYNGTEFNFSDRTVNYTGTIDTSKAGTYTVTYKYTPKRPIPGTNDFKELSEVTTTVTVTVYPRRAITLNYIDQDGNKINDSYLNGLPQGMESGDHFGAYHGTFTLNPSKTLVKDGNTSYKLTKVEKGSSILTENDYTLTFGDDVQEINLVYKSIATIKFVNDDDQGANLHDPLTQDSGNKDQVVELKDTKTIVDGIEGKDRYLGKIESGVTVTSAKDTNDKITSDGQPQVITYHFKNNQAKLTGKDITIAKGSTWDPASTLDKGTDYDGTEFNYSERTVNYTGTVDTSTVGEYTVTYKYTPKRPIPGANDSKELPEVTTTANVTVVDKQPITLEYVDQDGNKIDTKYLAGLSQDMASGAHFGPYQSTFTLNPQANLTFDKDVYYQFVQAEKTGDSTHTKLPSNTLTFGNAAQSIDLVYKKAKSTITIHFIDAGKGKELAKDVKTEEIGSTPLDLSETSSYIKSKIPDGYVYAKDSEIAGNGLKQTPEVKFLAKAQDVNVYLLGKPVRFKILHRIYMNPSKDVKGLRDLDMEVRTGYQYDFSLNNKDHAAPRGYTLIPGQESKTNGTVERDTVVILYYSRIR